MSICVYLKTYRHPPICEKEILRYAGCKSADYELKNVLNTCLDEVKSILTYKVCYAVLPVNIADGICDFGSFKVASSGLAKNLNGCEKAVIFAATIGIGTDRLIAKYTRLSPSKAIMLQAIGAERIEALCDCFCDDIKATLNVELKPRFSPGYGDCSLYAQKDIFALLGCEKKIGLTLNDSLLMTPSKSVTAFAGISTASVSAVTNKCELCNKKDCMFRRV